MLPSAAARLPRSDPAALADVVSSVEALLRAMEDPDPEEVFKNLETAGMLPYLIEMLRHPDAQVKQRCLQALQLCATSSR